MIVKDEAQNLPACLASVQAIADEIIVVDTGSSDHSCEIARQYGAKVFTQLWQDDFALARNHSLAQAQGDWVLAIDADETLDAESASYIRTCLADLQPALWMAQVVNYSEDHGQYIFPVVRLFPRSPDLNYIHAFHEILIDHSGRLSLSSALWLTIHHKGYQDSPQRRLKHVRNHRIIKGLVTKEPENPLWHIHLANYLYNHTQEMSVTWRHYQTALRLAEQTPDFKHNPTYQGCITELLWVCYQQQRTQMGLLLAQSQREWCQHLPDYWYHQGLLLRQNTDYSAAIASFQACLHFQPDQLIGIRYQVGHLEELPLFQIALSYRGWLHHPDTPAIQKRELKIGCQEAIASALRQGAMPLEQGLIWLLETLSSVSELEAYLTDEQVLAPATHDARAVLSSLAAVDSGLISAEQIFAEARQCFQSDANFKSRLLLKSYAFRFGDSEAILLLSQLQYAVQDLGHAERTLIEGLLFHPFEQALHQALKKIKKSK